MRVIEDDYIFRNECYQIIGCCMEVHKQLGCGFKEAVYQEALEMEFIERSLHYEREKRLKNIYKGKLLKKVFSPDFVCFDTIILEMKASKELTDLERLFNKVCQS